MKTTLKRQNETPTQIPEKKSAENAAGETLEKFGEKPSEKAAEKSAEGARKSAARKALVLEFLRYVVVGGIAFIADFGTFSLFRELVFGGGDGGNAAIVVSTAAGFIVGIAVNYVLSMRVVFTTAKQQKQGRNVRAVLIFVAVGLVGLLLTEALQWLGETKLLHTSAGQSFGRTAEDPGKYGKYIVKLVVTAIVLVWNYVGRKIFVFKGK